MRYETKFIVVHCSATRPSQDIGVKEIDRWIVKVVLINVVIEKL